MTLQEALAAYKYIQKHVDSPIAGTRTVSLANLSPGYYVDFKLDDVSKRSHVSTSQFYNYDEIGKIVYYAGEDGWEKQACQ